MAGIRWICISDLHLGALNSLLTPVHAEGDCLDPGCPSPVLVALCDALRTLRTDAEPPGLVVLGDLFELALGTAADAATTFAQLVKGLRPGSPDAVVAPRIRFVPGNHDHHLWTRARGASYLAHATGLSPSEPMPYEAHTTRLVPEEDPYPVRDALIELLALRADPEARIVVEQSYPNFGIMGPSGRRALVLSHGHFIEPLYRAMTTLEDLSRTPEGDAMSSEDLEAANGAWIDFFWSSMGDSGEVGRWARKIFESLQSDHVVEAEIDAIRETVARRLGSGWRGRIEGALLDQGLTAVAKHSMRRERHQPGTLSESGRSGLSAYLAGPVQRQMRDEQWAPQETTFVFGHTHKPFAEPNESIGLSGFETVINTGGWVVDTVEPEIHKGASVVLVDDDLNIAVLHCFGHGTGAGHQVTVEGPPREPDNPLVRRVNDRIGASAHIWGELAEATAATETERCRQLRDRLEAQADELEREA